MSDIKREMTQLLSSLQVDVFEFTDESHLHAGHAGNRGGGHYAVLIVSPQFEGHSRLARARMVQAAFAPLYQAGRIHALSIRAQTPTEYFH